MIENFRKFWKSKEIAKQNNPFAICHAQGLTGDKYEDCVMDLKQKFGIHKGMEEQYNVNLDIVPKVGEWVLLDNSGDPWKIMSVGPDGVCTLGREDRNNQGPDYTVARLGQLTKAVNINYAGPEPVSLLAGQDLEGETRKDIITSSQDKLNVIEEQSEGYETSKEKSSLVRKLREIQEKRQNATLKMRDSETKKSFKENWVNKKYK
jgi:hypothetical protein